MEIIQGTLGSIDEGTIPSPLVPIPFRQTITLTFVPSRVHVFLRGFDVAYDGGDHHLLAIRASVEWVAGPTPSTVDIVARGVVCDDSVLFGIRLAVHYTLVAE
jgi:hypothetical protein